ncbi:MAG: V-type ATP synthase subunit C [Firmicutes bacterium]|nr:V-type ATP synthase subunit C [Bacillota bacterium]
MTKKKEDSYAFPCAVIKANERTLLTGSDLERVMESGKISQAVTILGEFGYGDGKELANPRDFEKVLRAELDRVYKLVFSIVPDKEEIELFLLPSDYHNAKVLLKSEFLGIDPTPLLVDTGLMSAEKLTQLVRDRNYVFLSSEMKDALTEAAEIFSKGRDPQEIDIILDKACYRDMQRRAALTENDFIIGYVKLLIDILNVNTFIRLREIGKPLDFFRKVFLTGGNIDERVLTASYEEGYQQLADKLAPFGFREVFAVGATALQKEGRYTVLEKLCDDMRMKYVKDARYVSFGIEPVCGFLIAKESEVKNLRMILTGMLAGTAEEVTKERLREAYV